MEKVRWDMGRVENEVALGVSWGCQRNGKGETQNMFFISMTLPRERWVRLVCQILRTGFWPCIAQVGLHYDRVFMATKVGIIDSLEHFWVLFGQFTYFVQRDEWLSPLTPDK